jgi:uncharacterized OB-fold protein
MHQTFPCPRCGAANVIGRNFCIACGVKLIAICPYCGADINPASKYCGNCGAELIGAMQQRSTSVVQKTGNDTDQPSREEITVALIRFAAARAAEGKNRSQVADELARQGIPYDIAAEVVNRVFEYRAELHGKEGGKQMGCGLLMLIVGGIITGVSYLAAHQDGTYILTYGLIIIGLINLIIGFIRWLR